MPEKYHKLKQTKYIWLDSTKAEVLRSKIHDGNNYNVELQFFVKMDLKLSPRATVTVCGFRQTMTTADANPAIFRCKNVPNHQIADATHSWPIICMSKSPSSSAVEYETITYEVGPSENWKVIHIIIGNHDDPEHGMRYYANNQNKFILGLRFEDYEEVEVQPHLMETVRRLDFSPQDRVYNKLV